MKINSNDQDGFTLIELLVVITVIFSIFFILMKYTNWIYPVKSIWQYFSVYLISYLSTLSVLFLICIVPILISDKGDKFGLIALISNIIISFFIAYGSLLYFDINIPSEKSNMSIADIKQAHSAISTEFINIDKRAKLFQKSIQNIDKLTLSEINKIISELSIFVEEYKEIATKQSEKIVVLEKAAIDANQKAEKAKELLKTIKSLTKPQIEAVKFLITEDATYQSNKSFLLGITLSFPIGIFASLIAAWILRNFKKS